MTFFASASIIKLYKAIKGDIAQHEDLAHASILLISTSLDASIKINKTTHSNYLSFISDWVFS